jgi:response regulator RpfG family c-di-GMP phosphodiesterase
MHRSRPTVLFVHDDSDVRTEATRWLARGGFRCYVADDVPSASRMVRRVNPEVVVVSDALAGSGALVHQLAERPAQTAAVVMTDGRTPHSGDVEAWLPASHISLQSPLSADDLLHAVRSARTWRAEVARLEERTQQALATAVRRQQGALRQVVRTSSSAAVAHERLQRLFERPPALFGHAERVAGLAGEMARSLNLSQEACADIEAASLLHDIGKLALPEDVLSGTAAIGDAEMTVLLDSPARTLQLLAGTAALLGASQLIRRSREWWDGSGGPEGLSGWDIPVGARILAVADAIETAQDCEGGDAHARAALTNAVSRRAGTRLDPELVHVGLQANESRSCC